MHIKENNLSAAGDGSLKHYYRSWRTYLLLFMGLSVCVAALPFLVSNSLSISLLKAINTVGYDQMLDKTGLGLGVRNSITNPLVDDRLAYWVSQLYPANKQLQRNLGRVAMWNHDFKRASAILRQVRILDPHDTLAAWYLSAVYWQVGDGENARSVWRDLGIIGNLEWRYIQPAEVALKLNQWETCVVSARSALEIVPEDSYAYFLLGQCYQHLGRFEEALVSYNHAGEMAPQGIWFKSSSYVYMGQIYREQLGKPREALAEFQEAVRLEPGDVWSWAAIGGIYLVNLEQLPEAEAAYRHAATRLAVGHWGLAQVAVRQGRFAEAISEFAQVVVFEPTSANAHLDLAEAYLLDGQNEKALAEYQVVLQLDPGNQIAEQRVGLLEQNK